MKKMTLFMIFLCAAILLPVSPSVMAEENEPDSSTWTTLTDGLYTPTLIEVVLGKALMDLGMTPAATVAWLMGQPYDIPNSLSASRVVGWRIVATYGLLAFISAVLSGLVYGLLTGGF